MASKRFFARQFREADAEYVTQQLGIMPGVFDLNSYKETTARSHRKLILGYLGFQPFDANARQGLVHEIHTLIRSQVRPLRRFSYLCLILPNVRIHPFCGGQLGTFADSNYWTSPYN